MKFTQTLGLAILIATGFQVYARSDRAGGRPHMDEATKTAFKECFAATGVSKPERGQRPSEEDRAKIDACLKEKGISRPHDGQRRSRSSAGSEQ